MGETVNALERRTLNDLETFTKKKRFFLKFKKNY